MGEKKERGRFTLRFNEGDPIHEAAIGLLELQSPRTKAQYVANAVVYYNEHFRQEPQPLNASIISKEAVVAIVKEILRQEGMGQEKAKEQAITARLVEGSVAPVMPSTAQEVDDDSEMDDRTRRLIAGALSAFWCCTIKVDIENSKGQYIEKDKQEATKDGSESTKIQHGI